MLPPVQVYNRERIWKRIVHLFLGLGVLALLYAIYDLLYPSHFVGDMYGLEVMLRLALLGSVSAVMILGAVLLTWGHLRAFRNFRIVGAVLIVLSSSVLIANSLVVAQSRQLDRIRKGYASKSIEELLTIARDQKDQYAIDVLAVKVDPDSVPGLASILLNEHESGNLRFCAAQALTRIANREAREALRQARDSTKDEYFRSLISRIVEDRVPSTK